MDFKDSIKQIADRVEKLKESILTEEATKNALVLPFIQSLGYDVFNPTEVTPEYTCDIGTKKGEKIDYAINLNGKPCILIECKHWSQNLSLHDNQLLRYFHVSKAKFGLLTNGIQYKFYTDIVDANKMDEKPFLDVNILEIKEQQIEELKKFHKSYYDEEQIFNSANELKYANELKMLIANEFISPSDYFVRMLAKQVYPGVLTAKVMDQFTQLVKKAFTNYINDLITDRLKSALKTEESNLNPKSDETPVVEVAEPEKKIDTTSDELEGYYIVKSILRKEVNMSRIFYRDAQTYFAILLDDNNRKTICRLYLNGKKKFISLFDESKKETKVEIQSLDDIYKYSDMLLKAIAVLEKN